MTQTEGIGKYIERRAEGLTPQLKFIIPTQSLRI